MAEEKYYTVTVKLGQDDLVEYLVRNCYMSSEDVKTCNLRSEATELVNGILSDHFSDYVTFDSDSLVLGEFEEASRYWYDDNDEDEEEEDEE